MFLAVFLTFGICVIGYGVAFPRLARRARWGALRRQREIESRADFDRYCQRVKWMCLGLGAFMLALGVSTTL